LRPASLVLGAEALHALPFGVIRLDAEGRVAFFSNRETEQSGYGTRPAIGLPFFLQIAPCMASDAMQRAMDASLAQGEFALDFEHVGDFSDASRRLRVRAQSDGGGGLWICIARIEQASPGPAQG
jgi:photoactive yellow protein